MAVAKKRRADRTSAKEVEAKAEGARIVAKGSVRKRTVAKSMSAVRKAGVGKTAVGKARAAGRREQRPASTAEHDGSTMHLMTTISRLLVRALSSRLGPKGIGYGQYPVLQQLWDEDGLTQKELSDRVRIKAPTMVRTLDRMERDNLVTRERSKRDRRQIHIRLTAKGKRLKGSLASLSRQVDKVALSGMSTRDIRQFDRLMERVIDNLETDPAAN